MKMTTSVDRYLTDGCGRCAFGGTPNCKVHRWKLELEHLRLILLESGLKEESKCGVPCYTYQNQNVIILAAFKDYCSLSFFKGVLLKDKAGLLEKPGDNSQSARLIRFTKLKEISKVKLILKTYIQEAITLEKEGAKVPFKKISEFTLPEEFQIKLEEDPALKTAFKLLTPGRQRAYLIFFSAAKQSATRISRIEKCAPRILMGKGLYD